MRSPLSGCAIDFLPPVILTPRLAAIAAGSPLRATPQASILRINFPIACRLRSWPSVSRPIVGKIGSMRMCYPRRYPPAPLGAARTGISALCELFSDQLTLGAELVYRNSNR